MSYLLAALLLPLHFTAPTDTIGPDSVGRMHLSDAPVHAYVFRRIDLHGTVTRIPGYVDSNRTALLKPHAPGTRETVWLAPGESGGSVTIYVLSRDANGNVSAPSNGCVIRNPKVQTPLAARRSNWAELDVPIVKQTRERCGQAALSMVLLYYGAAPTALREVDAAYDPVLRGSLITDLAGAARRAGYDADVATLTPDSLVSLLDGGVPPILLYQNGSGPVTVRHFGVVTAWDGAHASFTLHDGTAHPRIAARDDLVKRWKTAGSQALIVRQRVE